MSRGVKTLESIVADVRLETGRSPSRNYGQDEYDAIKHLIVREQERLYWDHDWPFLRIQRDIVLQAGDRYYDWPADMNYERLSGIYVIWGNERMALERGITAAEYNVYNSDDDQRADPAEKWDIIMPGAAGSTAAAGEQAEIWPIPSQTGTIVRIEGFAKLQPFTADNDVCTLDSTLLTLFPAAEMLARDQKADAQAKLTAANRIYSRMRGLGQKRTPYNSFSMAGADPNPRYPRAAKIIFIAGS